MLFKICYFINVYCKINCITCCILQVDMFHSVLHLLLQQVPPHNENGSAKSAKSQKRGEEDNSSSGEETEEEEETMSEMFLNSDSKLFKSKMFLNLVYMLFI